MVRLASLDWRVSVCPQQASCWSPFPYSSLPTVSRVIYQKINFEQIVPCCPLDTVQVFQQALAAFCGLPPRSSGLPVLVGRDSALPRHCSPPRPRGSEPAKSSWNPRTGHSGSGRDHAWPSPGSRCAQGPFRQERKPPVSQVDSKPRRTLAVSACITRRSLPVPIGTGRPLPRLLAPGVLAAAWPSAPFPPGWSREEGKRWGPEDAGAQARAKQSRKAVLGQEV